MRYVLIDGALSPVWAVTYEGKRVTNPPDGLVDQLGAGYPLIEEEKPAYDPDTQTLTPVYALEEGIITRSWQAVSLPQPEPGTESQLTELSQRLAAVEEENEALREAIEAGVNL